MHTLLVSLSVMIGAPVMYEAPAPGCPISHIDERHKLKFGRYPPTAERRGQVQQQFAERSLRLFNKLDRDKDGVVTGSEWERSRKLLVHLACEGQPLDLEDYTIEKAQRMADTNADGQITRHEWTHGSRSAIQEHHKAQ